MIKTTNLTERIGALADSFVLEVEHKPPPDDYIPIQLATMKTTSHSYPGNPIFLDHQLR